MAPTCAPVLLLLLLAAPLLIAAQPDDTPDDFGAVVETEDQQLCDLTTLTFPASLAGEFGTEEPIPANYGNLTWSPQATLRRLSAGAPLFVRSKEALFFSVPDGFALTALWATVIDARIQPSQPAPNTTYTITISAVTTTGETKTSLCRVQVQTEFPSDVADLVPRGTAGRKMLQDVLPSPSPAPASLTAQEEPVFETRLDAFEEAPCDPSTDLNCNVDVVPVSKSENATLNAIPGTLCAIPTEQVMDFSNITSISITQLNQVDILPDGSYSTELSTATPAAAGQVSVYGLAYQLKSPCPPKPLD